MWSRRVPTRNLTDWKVVPLYCYKILNVTRHNLYHILIYHILIYLILGLTPFPIRPALGDRMDATALDTFCTSLDELDLVRFDMDFGVGGIFFDVFVLLNPFSFAGVDGFAPNLVSWRRFSFLAFSLASFSDSRAWLCSSF